MSSSSPITKQRRTVRFSVRQMFLVVAWLAIVLATYGHIGLFYAATLGAMYGLAIYLADRLLRQWATLPTDHRLLLVGALGLVGLGTALGVIRMVEDKRRFTDETEQLESRIHEDARFARVTAAYSGAETNAVLTIGGQVTSQQDLNALKQYADDNFLYFKRTVVWRVEIVP